jgi:hypothetical protein
MRSKVLAVTVALENAFPFVPRAAPFEFRDGRAIARDFYPSLLFILFINYEDVTPVLPAGELAADNCADYPEVDEDSTGCGWPVCRSVRNDK